MPKENACAVSSHGFLQGICMKMAKKVSAATEALFVVVTSSA